MVKKECKRCNEWSYELQAYKVCPFCDHRAPRAPWRWLVVIIHLIVIVYLFWK